MIYVDRNQPCVSNTAWKWNTVCHMWCDGDLEELHQFAVDLGLRRAWFQPSQRPNLKPWQRSHYDLTPRVRKLAIKNGAVEASRDDLARWLGREDLLTGGTDAGAKTGQSG